MTPLIGLMYLSSEHRPFSEDALLDLVSRARLRNAEAQISGVMLYARATFLQYLEGPEEAVIELFSKIQNDPRHHGIIELIHRPIESREFGEWSMAFMTPEESLTEDPSLQACLAEGNPQNSHVKLLLQNFWTTNKAA